MFIPLLCIFCMFILRGLCALLCAKYFKRNRQIYIAASLQDSVKKKKQIDTQKRKKKSLRKKLQYRKKRLQKSKIGLK